MINKILRAKHWQLFLVHVGLPLVAQVVLMVVLLANIGVNGPDPTVMFTLMPIFPFILVISIGVLFGWFWGVGVELQSLVPSDVQLKVKRFKILLFFPAVYMLLFLGFFTVSFSAGPPNPLLFALIFPLHLFSMFCMFHSLYFVAKTFKTIELQRAVTFGDFAGEFFLIWFFPIGVWFVQPRINKLVETRLAQD